MKVKAIDNKLDAAIMLEIDNPFMDIVKFKLPDDSAGFSLYLEVNHNTNIGWKLLVPWALIKLEVNHDLRNNSDYCRRAYRSISQATRLYSSFYPHPGRGIHYFPVQSLQTQRPEA